MNEIEQEERAIYIIIVVALSPVLVALAYSGARVIDPGTALSVAIVTAAAIGIKKMRAARLPPAQVVGSRRR